MLRRDSPGTVESWVDNSSHVDVDVYGPIRSLMSEMESVGRTLTRASLNHLPNVLSVGCSSQVSDPCPSDPSALLSHPRGKRLVLGQQEAKAARQIAANREFLHVSFASWDLSSISATEDERRGNVSKATIQIFSFADKHVRLKLVAKFLLGYGN